MEPCMLPCLDQFVLSNDTSCSQELEGQKVEIRINLRLGLDEIAEVEVGQLRGGARSAPIGKELRKLANDIYGQRRLRDRIVGERLFGEPAWDMLLALYCFPARGEMLSITSLCYAAEVPIATGIRWQKLLADQRLIEHGPDAIDRRKRFVRLTSVGKAMMDRILTRLHHAGVAASVGYVAGNMNQALPDSPQGSARRVGIDEDDALGTCNSSNYSK
jgi:DNA-binding MarR family transcriptional regulator